jgi:hypothetical protein
VMKQKIAATASVTHHRPCVVGRAERAGVTRARVLRGAAGSGVRTPSVGGVSVGALGTDTVSQCDADEDEQAGE